jgi:hypothetical protein
MKIWFRTEAGRGGEQSPQQHRSVNPTSPKSLWSPQHPVSSDTSPTKNPVAHSLRRGTACYARCNALDRRRSLALGRSIPAVAPRRRTQFPRTSTRFCRKSRTCTKQTIKPFLRGARIAHHGFRSACSPGRAGSSRAQSRGVSSALLGLELASLSARATRTSAPACPADGRIPVISNRELLVLEIPQLIENKHRQPVLIENFEPNSAPVFPAFVSAAFRQAAFSLLEILRKRSVDQEAA